MSYDPLDDAEDIEDFPDEPDDDRGPVCVECRDTLPIGHEGKRCDDCAAELDIDGFLETAEPEELAAF